MTDEEPATPTDHTINPLKIEGINDSPLKKHGHDVTDSSEKSDINDPGYTTPKDHMIDAINNEALLDSPQRNKHQNPINQQQNIPLQQVNSNAQPVEPGYETPKDHIINAMEKPELQDSPGRGHTKKHMLAEKVESENKPKATGYVPNVSTDVF